MPDTEPPFVVSTTALLPQLSQPRPGTRLAVLYDPEDHNRVALDHRQEATADRALDAIRAARPDLAGAEVMGMPLNDVIGRAMADPNAFREEMMRRSAEMQQQGMAAAAAMQSQIPGNPTGYPPPQTPDPIDRLERLANLKERGLITDEEFVEQKRRILGD
ncbi:SHOCT domain-containing protein [Mycolicibacterium moriokaense]|nr:SHOCT domain-containing protein [Mycolicibacterium moriokaense]